VAGSVTGTALPKQSVSVGVTELFRGFGTCSEKSVALLSLSSPGSSSVAQPGWIERRSAIVDDGAGAGEPAVPGSAVVVPVPQLTQSTGIESTQAAPAAELTTKPDSVKSGLPGAPASPTRIVLCEAALGTSGVPGPRCPGT